MTQTQGQKDLRDRIASAASAAEPELTTTELADRISADPRFTDPASGLFAELAALHGEDFAGVAFFQALLKAAGEIRAATAQTRECSAALDFLLRDDMGLTR